MLKKKAHFYFQIYELAIIEKHIHTYNIDIRWNAGAILIEN